MKSKRDLTIADIAAVTGKHPETLRQLARMGRLHAYKVGGLWLVPREAFERLRGEPLGERPDAGAGGQRDG